MSDDSQRPIIVKKIKKGGHGHHGGAWKIAYADFVTAMMAFFLLMWLLGSTTDGDKKGIADYFGSPLKMALMSSGSGAGDAAHVVKGGGQDLSNTTGQVKRGEIQAPRDSISVHKLKAEQVRAEAARLQALQSKVERAIEDNAALAAMRSQIVLDMTHDGLRIQIVDHDRRPMFASGSAVVEPPMRLLLRELGIILKEVPNRLTLEGHTDAVAYADGERGYSNWELSAERANASRRELIAGGLAADRVLRVQGLAASNLYDRKDPASHTNRRISIIVMTREAEDRAFSGEAARFEPPSIVPDLTGAAPSAGRP